VKSKLVRIVLGSALAIACTLPVGYSTFGDHDYSGDCRKRLDTDRARIDHDSAKYGEHSGRVDRDIARMDDDRSWCRNHHSDWDHSLFDVGIYVKH